MEQNVRPFGDLYMFGVGVAMGPISKHSLTRQCRSFIGFTLRIPCINRVFEYFNNHIPNKRATRKRMYGSPTMDHDDRSVNGSEISLHFYHNVYFMTVTSF